MLWLRSDLISRLSLLPTPIHHQSSSRSCQFPVCITQTKASTSTQSTHRVHSAALAAPSVEEASKSAVQVNLGDRTYPIYISEGILDQGELLKRHIPGKQVLIVTNETIAPLYLERCKKALSGLQVEVVILPDGEQHKTLEVVSLIWDEALRKRLNRNCTFVALGGGVIGDMTGYAAASYQRGVNFIQIPTTVMATVDSSVGGKTGVNHPLGKNMIGAFYQPQCVLIDTCLLDTLPRREHASGVSEIIKYGLIRDAQLFAWLEEHMQALLDKEPRAVKYAIERSCINKAEVVAADEREGGVRATLNLGHTFGHAMETWQGYGVWLHGEAVAAGIVIAADLSYRLGWIDKALFERTQRLIEQAELPVAPPKGMTVEDFMDLMAVDKKAVDGQLRFILLKGELGNCLVTGDFDKETLLETIRSYCSS